MASLPTNYDWAVGFFRQACYDYFHGRAIRGSPRWFYGQGLGLAQLQQSAEKSMKAAVFWETRKLLQRDDPALLSHQIWCDSISKDAHLRSLKNSILDCLGAPEDKIKELENYAPHGANDTPNSEYPWLSSSEVAIPATHFSGRNMADLVAQMEGIADAIVLHIRGRNRTFTRHFEIIKAQMLMLQEADNGMEKSS